MQRSVQYWRLVNVDGSPLSGAFPADKVVDQLSRAATKGKDRHRRCHDGMVLIGHAVPAAANELPMLILDKVRRENLPSVGDSGGHRRAIGLNPTEGLLEPTYCMFGANNVVALLTSGNGPRANRLVEYLRSKLSLDVRLDPVLTQDLDRVLDEMRASSIEVAIPSHRVNRELIGGDWAAALEAGRVLADNDGVIRVGMSVGHRGTKANKSAIRQRIRSLVDQLRSSGAVDQFSKARVTGTIRGSQRAVDLHSDQFVERVEVDADVITDPDHAAAYAREVMSEQLIRSAGYLRTVVPDVGNDPSGHAPRFVDRPDDERDKE